MMKKTIPILICTLLLVILTGCGSKITLANESLELYMGESGQIEATTKDSPVSYTSSDASVVSVDKNGQITTVGVGTATITATNSKQAVTECVVTVLHVQPTQIALDTGDIVCDPGETIAAPAVEYTPANTTDLALSWGSSDTSVATVGADGMVTTVTRGTAVISAASANGVSASYSVTVRPYADSILFDDALSLSAGESHTLSVTYAPNDCFEENILWTSTDDSVASVVDGKITAIAPGTATIKAETEVSHVSAECSVAVRPYADSIDIGNSAEVIVGESTTLKVTFLPEDCSHESIAWISSDTSIATVSDGKITAVAPGRVTITAETSSSKLTASCTVTVKPVPVGIGGVSLSRSASVVGSRYSVNFNLSTSGTGGTGKYTFNFDIIQNGSVTRSSGWTNNNGISANLSGNGTLEVRITVKDSEGNTATQTVNLLQ